LKNVLFVVVALPLCASCGSKDNYPDLSEVPDRPEASLSAERSETVAEELRSASDEAIRYATEGRPDTAGDEDMVAEDLENTDAEHTNSAQEEETEE